MNVAVALLIWAAIVVVSMLVVAFLAIRWRRDPFGFLLLAAALGPIAIIALVGTHQSDVKAGPRFEAGAAAGDAHTILIASDGSESSLRACRYVVQHHRPESSVVLLATLAHDQERRDSPAQEQEHARAVERMTSAARAMLADAGIPVTVEIGYGNPGPTIVDSATRHDVETIVLGRKGAGLTKAVLGSVSDYVVKNAGRSVVVVD